jgi:hypothetical protein
VYGKCVNAARQLIRKNPVNHAMALDSGLSFEGRRHDIDSEMRLSARSVSGMAFMPVGFVFHLEALRGESLGQLLCDEIGGAHAARLEEGKRAVNGTSWRNQVDELLSSLEGVAGKGA